MKIALLSSAFFDGGAARVLTIMANHWVACGHEVFLFSFEDGSTPPFYPLHPEVRVEFLSLNRYSPHIVASLVNNWKRLVRIRRSLVAVEPDAVISFIDTANIRTLVALLGTGIPVIISERVHPAHEDIGALWSLLRRIIYPLADSLVVQTSGIESFFGKYAMKDMRIIPNPVVAFPDGSSLPGLRSPMLTAVGRLAPQKGYALLLRAFARIADKHPDWTLGIAGEGPQRAELEKQIVYLGLRDRVVLFGQIKDVQGLLRHADAYVMSSLYEGFPNALCEAMSAGLPCISTDCPSGPSDVIVDGVNGILCPVGNESLLSAALDRVMGSASLRERLGTAASGITERYGLARIMGQWETCLGETIATARGRWSRRFRFPGR
jgi:glycosyltransferase involved in cell wall biosynthesis